MKSILRLFSLLFVGVILFSACTDVKTGNSSGKMILEIEVDSTQNPQDSIPLDTSFVKEPIAPVVPSPPPPLPRDPWPEPEPGPDPIVVEPEPFPEPIPTPVQNPIVDFPDVDPHFPGDSRMDTKNLLKFISDNIQYPKVDREMELQGRVYVEFIVEKDGSITSVKVLRGVSRTLDKEAIRIMRLMPKWIPGELNGEVVRCRTRLPITFKLD